MTAQAMFFLRSRPEFGSVLIALLLALFFSVSSEGVWLNIGNIESIFQVTAILAIMAFGQSYVITVGEIDISVGSIFGVSALTYLGLAESMGALVAVPAALTFAVFIGFLNGIFVNYFRIPSLIATLGTLFVFRGIAYALTEDATYAATTELRETNFFHAFGGDSFLGFNTAIWWAIGVLFILHVTLFYTPFGNRILAIGGHEGSALSRGVRTNRMKVVAFMICGLTAGFAGVLEANHIGFADGSFGRLMELEAIASTVLGGCILAGGRSSIIGTLCGAFILSGIQSYLVVMSIQPQWYMFFLGIIVILASFSNNKIGSLIKI
ncbi:ABC transporter permease [Vibrio sp.]|uniref:ABC transporter permease n=1 Tax=Vibrio viridaestus TaxID=2487322 RepID=A0A3N9TKS1_9VIBR|nr:ABC transporter permease [Vibrio viridaestus]MDC0612496.1 ABC transporter permease [Vibrio sp.]RQW64949.1 ABC transporter permease [Vibrio viridaestus]